VSYTGNTVKANEHDFDFYIKKMNKTSQRSLTIYLSFMNDELYTTKKKGECGQLRTWLADDVIIIFLGNDLRLPKLWGKVSLIQKSA
jgi:hypothetical protein